MKHNSWPDKILHGIHIGEHGFNPETIIEEIKERCIERNMNYVVLRPHQDTPEEYFFKWAEYLAENKIYFMLLYSVKYDEDGNEVSMFSSEGAKKFRQAGGEYYLGDVLGEQGSSYTFKSEGFFGENDPMYPKQGVSNAKDAEEKYISMYNKYIAADKKVGFDEIACVEATGFIKYNLKAGATIPILEMLVGDPERLIAITRGCAKAHSSKAWGTYMAHEWYGGRHHEDILKRKRLPIAYKYAYLAGSDIFCLESGDDALESFGSSYPYESELCGEYRKVLDDFTVFVKNDGRPKGNPKVKIAFVSGNHDGWAATPMGSVLWGQFENKNWGYGDAEYSWRILDDINRSIPWNEMTNHGANDFGAYVPYGQYDIIPATASAEKMSEYEYLIFVGFNAMTEEIYDNLKAYVSGGGKLLMTAAHLNMALAPGEPEKLIHGGDVTDLFGCRLNGSFESKDGFKFVRSSMLDNMKYSGATDYNKNVIDPYWHSGYVRYAKAALTTGRTAAIAENSFAPVQGGEKQIAYIENKLGKGFAFLLTSLDYPGAGGVYPFYRLVVTTLINHSHSCCDIKVFGCEKLRFSVYEPDTVYLLNTDYECNICAKVEYGNNISEYVLSPGQLIRVQL